MNLHRFAPRATGITGPIDQLRVDWVTAALGTRTRCVNRSFVDSAAELAWTTQWNSWIRRHNGLKWQNGKSGPNGVDSAPINPPTPYIEEPS